MRVRAGITFTSGISLLDRPPCVWLVDIKAFRPASQTSDSVLSLQIYKHREETCCERKLSQMILCQLHICSELLTRSRDLSPPLYISENDK